MKIDRNKLKKCTTEVPPDCKLLIDKLRSCTEDELLNQLQQTSTWTVGKCELYHWVDVLDRFDGILAAAAHTGESEWLLAVNTDSKLKDLTLSVLHFTSLLIEYSFSRHSYSSVEHLISLLSSSNLDVILSVLNLLYVFSKRSNFLSRLSDVQRLPLLKRLSYLAESWGGKENGFGLAESCLNKPVSPMNAGNQQFLVLLKFQRLVSKFLQPVEDATVKSFPSNATTLHYEFYASPKDINETNQSQRLGNTNMFCIHVEDVHQMSSSPADIMESLSQMYPVPHQSKMLLYTHLRLAHSFAEHQTRLKCVQARLHAISVLVYTNNISDIGSVLYSGFTEELVDVLQVKDNSLVDIKAAALRTLTSIVHLDCRDRTPRLAAIVDVTGVSQYHGFLPVLVRRCIDSMTSSKSTKEDVAEFPHNFATALFSFLYHLSSYESGGEALVQSGMMGPLLSVVTNMGDQQEQTTFVTRAVRVIDLITNIDWQAFQAVNGLQVFIDRLEHEVVICRRDAPPACDTLPGASAASASSEDVSMDIDVIKDDGSNSSAMDTEENAKTKIEYKQGAQCLPQRAALFKSVLNFLKKAISDQAFGEQVRHMMDGTLPTSLKHIIGNVEYYGPALFLLAMEVVTVYVFQEPSLLSSLQDNKLTNVMLHALLVKDPPATREVLASLPNIFSALCLNSRGLEAFVNCSPFDSLFRVMLSPEYLLAMRRRRSSDPLGDTASNLGNAMDELMRHQPTLRSATMKAIHGLLTELQSMGSDPATVCSRSSTSKGDLNAVGADSPAGDNAGDVGSQTDESTAQDDAGSEDEVEEVTTPTTKSATSTSQMSLPVGGKKHIPLLDYMQNVTKFIHAIVSNNTTDDHCREFRQHGGIPALLGLLRLPALPLDFPASPSCQSVTNLMQTVFLLLREPTVLTESLAHVRDILQHLQPLFFSPNNTNRWASVLLQELMQQKPDAAEKEDMPLVRSLVHIHAFVTLFLNMPRANQNEIRTIIVEEWGSKLGCEVLRGLSQLYRSLIWESTVLLALRTPGTVPEGSGFGEKELAGFLSEKTSGQSDDAASFAEPASSQAMDTDLGDTAKVGQSKTKEAAKANPALIARNKLIKPVLSVASSLVRSLAELFGLLVKLAVGKPIRQRYNRHIAVPSAHNTAPTRPARALSRHLSSLLKDGLSWQPPIDLPSSKLRVTFLICTVGFTIPMLFDDRHMPYHLMLQYFVGTGAHNALFESFKWALSSDSTESKESNEPSPSELPGSVDDFLDAWLMLVERLVNPNNILNSPHLIHDRPPSLHPPDAPPPIKAPFSAVKFLIKTQKATLEALQHLWSSGRLSRLSTRICDAVILILCHLIRGEQIARDKLKEEREETKAKGGHDFAQDAAQLSDLYNASTSNQSRPASNTASSRIRQIANEIGSNYQASIDSLAQREHDPNSIQQLMDMGFPRENCIEALNNSSTVEGAAEWLLTHSFEEDQLIRAITMSLENNAAAPAEESTPEATEQAASENTPEEEAPEEFQPTTSTESEEKEPEISQPSQEEINKKEEFEAVVKADQEEIKILCQDDEEPMSANDIDDFAANIFEGSLQLVNQLPDTVYRVCDVIVVLMKRAGKEWSDGVFEKLVHQIKEKCEKLLQSYKNRNEDIWVQDDASTHGLATQVLLFTLLFEEMKESCTRLFSESKLLTTLVRLLTATSTWVKEHEASAKSSATPKWISPVLLLIDLYQRSCVALRCRNNLNQKYTDCKREWKWFDDRSGRWCSYSASNHKSIDDAYLAGQPSVRFTAGRRRYTINFHQLIQFNEESLNRRPIMATYSKDASKKKETGLTKSQEAFREPPSDENQMETESSTSRTPFASGSQIYTELSEQESEQLVIACTAFVCLPVDADSLHACMRMLLRLTRTGTENGHQRAILFAELGGASALLKLKNIHGFIGFASLATLLLRHILEDQETLKITMEKTVRNICSSGAGNAGCGVTTGSTGSKELHYVLRALAPAACQHSQLFIDACRNNMRIALPSITSRLVESMETALVGPNGVQTIRPSNKTEPLQYSSNLSPVVVSTIRQLLDALVAVKDETKKGSSTAKSDSNTTQSPNSSDPTSDQPPKLASDEKENKQGDNPLVTKSSILRLIAELVRSYPSCASLIVSHQYKADASPLVKHDCSALSFILDHLLVPRTKPAPEPITTPTSTATTSAPSASAALHLPSITQTQSADDEQWDKDCPALARVFLSCLAVSPPVLPASGPDPHLILVNELKSALSRAVHLPESEEKHTKLRSLLEIISAIIECTSKTTTSQSRRTLGRQQTPDTSNLDPTSSHVPRMMMKRGLASDLAKVPHFIDLGSPDMAETVNAALKPLEVLTRWTSTTSTAKAQDGGEKKEVTETVSVAPSSNQNLTVPSEAPTDTSTINWPATSEDQAAQNTDVFEADIEDNASDEYMDVMPEDNISQESDLQYLDASEEQPTIPQEDVFMEPVPGQGHDDDGDLNVVVLGRRMDSTSGAESEHIEDSVNVENQGLDDVSQDDADDIADDTINGDESTEDSDQDDDDDDQDDDDDLDDDDGSDMDNGTMNDGYLDDFNYDTFVYDIIQNDQPAENSDLFIHLEDIFGGMMGQRTPRQLVNDLGGRRISFPPLVIHGNENGSNSTDSGRTIPPPPGTVATCHPLLVRHANHAQAVDSSAMPSGPSGQNSSHALGGRVTASGQSTTDRWSQRMVRGSGFGVTSGNERTRNDNSTHNQTIHLHFNQQPRTAPMVLQRLLGPAVAQDILQISNTLYNEGGGRIQLPLNTPDFIRLVPDDITDQMFLDSMQQYERGIVSSAAAISIPDHVPTSLARWVEESCVLDAQSLYDNMTFIKDEIVEHLTKLRDEELKERKEKRKEEAERQKDRRNSKKDREAIEKLMEPLSQTTANEAAPAVTAEQVASTASPPTISTPSNTPVATRPDSPTVSSTVERAPAINALQQASSSLLAVSGQLEGLSFTLQQSRGQTDNEEVQAEAATAQTSKDAGTASSGQESSAPTSQANLETATSDASLVVMDTTSPVSNRSDVSMEANDVDERRQETTEAGDEIEAEASSSEQAAHSEDAAQVGQVMEGVDPSFLAALPADIRQEVIREQLSRSSQHSSSSTSAGGSQQASGVSPEFLAALPPNIQEEVLEQERRERSRNAAAQSVDDNLDPTTFIQTLPAELRQSVLADMDESLMAVLSEELAAEAQSLRGDVEERQRRNLQFQERFLSRGVDLLRHGGPPRVRHRTFESESQFFGGGLRRRNAYFPKKSAGASGPGSTLGTTSRQVLDHDSLACLLLLLFVEESKLNTNFLHRIFRNLCYHAPTRDWLVASLVAVLQRAGDVRPVVKAASDTTAMDVTPSSPPKMQKQFSKKPTPPWSPEFQSPTTRNRSWMSIRLEAALGSRSSIFHIESSSRKSQLPTAAKESKSADWSGRSVLIHPQAAPVVCRHTIDALIVLSKIFPSYFVTSQSLKNPRISITFNNDDNAQVETDFWDTLMKLDYSTSHKKKLNARLSQMYEDDASGQLKSAGDSASSHLNQTWLGVMMRMLCHPVVKRSQQLTDRMLRLLAQISRNIPTSNTVQTGNKKTSESAPAASDQAAPADSAATSSAPASQAANSRTDSEGKVDGGNSTTVTMSAHAGTSNTSTVGRSEFSCLTNTTSSSRSHGSISTASETPVAPREEKHDHLEKELSIAVGVLTSHACSEEGLEDATSLLLQLSKSSSSLRLLIIRLLLEGAQKLGGFLAQQIKTLLSEMVAYNKQQLESGSSANQPTLAKGSILNRFDSSLTVVLSAKDKFKKLGRELQLPSMQNLTSNTSHQAFFLRILKVIIQLQQASKGQPITDFGNQSRTTNSYRWRSGVSPFIDRDADVLMDILAPRRRNFLDRPNQSSSTTAVSSSATSEAEPEPDKEEPRLSERLQLDELWDVLGCCLKELSKGHDQHAVLVLQPAVEAFFLVHASETSQSIARRNANVSEPETRESQLAHINEQPPVSPGQPAAESVSESSASLSSQSSLVDASMPLDTQKFLKFAETHRTVLNQILRQTTVPLSEGPFSVLVDHTRVLDFDVKRRYFRQELERAEDSSMRRDDVAIRVRRDHLFEDSFRELHRRTPNELRSRLYVVFDGEDGQDAGGVLREWYLVISREIFNPMYALFRTSPGDHGTYAINPLSYVNSNHLSYFKFVGRIVAKAIYDNKLLECYFTRSFYKHILGKPVKYTDMEAEDYEFSQGLLYLLEHDISALCTELNFSVEIEEFGKTETRDLKEGGRDLMVTEKNKREYVHLVCQEKMTGAIKKQLAAFLEGFYEIIPKRLISIFDEQELELLISGLPNIDIEDLRANTEYHKYQNNSLQIQWFWRALRSFDQAERAKFLQFVTGTSKVPLQGFAALEGMTGIQKFQIHRDDRSTSRLPCAHTCFNQLDLPAYETYYKLRERLLLAISECTEGFGLA